VQNNDTDFVGDGKYLRRKGESQPFGGKKRRSTVTGEKKKMAGKKKRSLNQKGGGGKGKICDTFLLSRELRASYVYSENDVRNEGNKKVLCLEGSGRVKRVRELDSSYRVSAEFKIERNRRTTNLERGERI